MTIRKATEPEIQKAIAELGTWAVKGGKLHREYKFPSWVNGSLIGCAGYRRAG